MSPNPVTQDRASQDRPVTQDRVDKIAEAVLYEGYMLYPYRASAVKISSAGTSACSARVPTAKNKPDPKHG
jgi:hypothetical protein